MEKYIMYLFHFLEKTKLITSNNTISVNDKQDTKRFLGNNVRIFKDSLSFW